MFSGLKLSQSWVTVSKDPRYKKETSNCREPYPVLSNIAFGNIGSWVSRISCLTTFFFIACIFLIMGAQMMTNVLASPYFEIEVGCACDKMI